MDQGNNVSTGDKSGMSASRPMSMGPVTAQTFATQAATIGKAEIELGQLAMKNGKDDSVKEYAQRMVKDHTVADAKLKTIAARENLTLPSDLDAEHKAVKQKLSSLKGDEFDAAYRAEMAKGHQKAIALFQSASQTNALPDDLRQFAASTLPTLKQHHEMAESLETDEASDSMTR
jgi:putative membrane protein